MASHYALNVLRFAYGRQSSDYTNMAAAYQHCNLRNLHQLCPLQNSPALHPSSRHPIPTYINSFHTFLCLSYYSLLAPVAACADGGGNFFPCCAYHRLSKFGARLALGLHGGGDGGVNPMHKIPLDFDAAPVAVFELTDHVIYNVAGSHAILSFCRPVAPSLHRGGGGAARAAVMLHQYRAPCFTRRFSPQFRRNLASRLVINRFGFVAVRLDIGIALGLAVKC